MPRALVWFEPVEDDHVAAVVPGERLVGVRIDDFADEQALDVEGTSYSLGVTVAPRSA